MNGNTLRLRPLFVLLAAAAPHLAAQTFQAQITGTVRDASAALAPNVKVTATNIATGVPYSTESNAQGFYRLPALPPSRYKIAASAAGFKTFEQGPITLQVNDVVEVEIVLQVGDASEKVLVSASAELLQTATATVGTVVNARSIENLPLNVRDPLALVGLTAGVTFGPNFGNGGGQELGRNFFKSDFNVGGGRSGAQELLLDGAANTTPDLNRGIINPPVDSVQEFKVQTNSYDAEFGRTTGGIVNVITKSGANDFHGLLYDFERHSAIEANNWFSNRAGLPNPSFKRHQFGANASGPILKNRTFFFADYEGLRQGFPITFVSSVPTEAQRAGNFSQTLASDATPILVHDPDTLTTLATGARQRTPFPGNIIPAARFDAVARKVSSYYPAANQTGDRVTGLNNFVRSAGSNINTDKFDGKVDQNFGERTRLFGRYSQQKDVRLVPGPLPGPIGGGRSTTDTYRQAVADLTRVFSPTLIANAQFAFSRALAAQFGLSKGFNLSELGLPAALTALGTDQFIQGSIADIGGIANGSDSFVQYQPRNTWTTRASVSQVRGSHNLKAGLDWRILNFNEGQNTQPNGTYTFGRTFTQGPNPVQASRNGGFGFADFLLGMPSSGAIRQLMPISTQGGYFALFVQDDWRVNDRLTFNLGLRWDRATGNREKYNRLAYFDPTAANPLAARAGLPNLTGLLRWIGGDGNAANQLSTPKADFAPRFGFAFKVTKKSVLRGGYGVFFAPRSIVGNGNGAVEAFRDTPLVGSIDGGLTNASRLSNPFPQGVLPALNARDPLANVGASIQAPLQNYKTGYAQLFSLNYQVELPGAILMQAGYSGNKGTHILSGGWNINQLPDQYLPLGNQLNNQVRNPFQGLIAAGALSGPTISLRQSLLPFPQYSGDNGVTQVFVPAGNDTYHALSLQGEKRLSETLTFLTSYTWSKAIDDVGGMIDVYNRRLNKVLSAFDTPHQWVGSWVYKLPFGKGRAVGSSWKGPVNTVLGGWDFDGIVRVQSGQPVAIGGNNLGRSARLDEPTIARWFDTSAFVNTPAFTIQTTGPRSPDVRNDFTRNLDAVVVKNFKPSIKDREMNIQFRAECFNLTNTPQFNSPNGTVTSQAFGQVTSQRNTSRQFQFGLKVKF